METVVREPARATLAGSAGVLAAATTWGVSLPLTKPLLDDFGPAQLTVARFLFALPVMVVVGRRAGGLRLPLRLALPLSLTGMVGYFLFTNLGLERTAASTAALVQGLAPAVTGFLAIALLRHRPDRRLVAGIVLAVAGAAVIAWGTVSVQSLLGIALVGLGVLSWGLYTVLGHVFGDRVSSIAATVFPSVIATVLLTPFAALEDFGSPGAGDWLLVLLLGVGASGLAYVAWNYGVARVPPAHAGVYLNVSPVVSLVVARLALDEHLAARQLAGGAIVLAGAVLASLPRNGD